MTDNGAERLRYAIVKQACDDLAVENRWLKKNKASYMLAIFHLKLVKKTANSQKVTMILTGMENELNQHQKAYDDAKNFFKSKWYSQLCALDGQKIMSKVLYGGYKNTTQIRTK